MKSRSFFLTVATIASLALDCSFAQSLGKIAFVGDSITQGFDSSINRSPQAGYRYQFWKGLVDNKLNYGEDYSFVGSQKGSCHSGSLDQIGSKTPDYQGQSFENIHEGHFNWKASYLIGGENIPAADLQQNRGSGTIGSWLSSPSNPGGYSADTVFIMLGTNDLYKGRSQDQLVSDIRGIVEAYQASNKNARIYVMSVTPPSSSAGTAMRDKVNNANKAFEAQSPSWSTASSMVSYVNIGQGMSAGGDNSSWGVMNIDNWHPNDQGELIMSGNLLKAIGKEGQSAGILRKTKEELSSHVSLTNEGIQSLSSQQISIINNTTNAWEIANGQGTLNWNGGADGAQGPCISGDWISQGGDLTLDFSICLSKVGPDNNFQIQLGNGIVSSGLLQINEGSLTWMGSYLYNVDMTEGFQDIRIVYTKGNSETSTASGYYVWLNGQLIGNALQSKTGELRDGFLIGAVNANHPSQGSIRNLSYDVSGAFATKSVPEPSSSCLVLSGICLLSLRRKCS